MKRVDELIEDWVCKCEPLSCFSGDSKFFTHTMIILLYGIWERIDTDLSWQEWFAKLCFDATPKRNALGNGWNP